jgi:hypothetical protein
LTNSLNSSNNCFITLVDFLIALFPILSETWKLNSLPRRSWYEYLPGKCNGNWAGLEKLCLSLDNQDKFKVHSRLPGIV